MVLIQPPNEDPENTIDVDDIPPPSAIVEKPIIGTLIWEEVVRAGLAFAFVAVFAGTVVGGFLRTDTEHWSATSEFLQLILPAQTALLGSAVGFYFGTRQSR
jgi:hypothetical protein